MYSAEEIKAAVISNAVRFIPHHECGVCQCAIGYTTYPTQPDAIYFSTHCGCSSHYVSRLSKWEDLAKWINQQTGKELEKYKQLLDLT